LGPSLNVDHRPPAPDRHASAGLNPACDTWAVTRTANNRPQPERFHHRNIAGHSRHWTSSAPVVCDRDRKYAGNVICDAIDCLRAAVRRNRDGYCKIAVRSARNQLIVIAPHQHPLRRSRSRKSERRRSSSRYRNQSKWCPRASPAKPPR